MRYLISNLFSNNTYLNIIRGQEQWVGTDPEKITEVATQLRTIMNQNTKTAEKYLATKTVLHWCNKFYCLACDRNVPDYKGLTEGPAANKKFSGLFFLTNMQRISIVHLTPQESGLR